MIPRTRPSLLVRRALAVAFAFAVLAPALALAATAEAIPAKPTDLTYPPLDFQVPRAEQYRHSLGNGVVVYVVEDHALPLVDVGVQVRVGSFLEPESKAGLAGLTGTLMRKGGTASLGPAELDEQADRLAADLSVSIGSTSGSARMNCLTQVLEPCLKLFFETLAQPRFDASRLELEKSNILEDLKQRNDEPSSIARREWQWLLYGNEHFSSRMVTGESLAAITQADLVEFHRSYWRPENMILEVAGDVDTQAVLAQLERHFAASFPAADQAAKEVPWPPPPPRFVPRPGVFVVEKDIPQGRVQIGHLGIERKDWDDPRVAALSVMNEVLGGGGFTSRITKRIRSDEGLAYSAGSGFSVGTFWPGTFSAFFQSKSETVAYAAEIAIEEVKRIQSAPITDEELQTAKASFIETFPRNFESAQSVASIFASDEYLGRPHRYWYEYRDRVSKVSKEDVQKMASEYLDPTKLVFLVVGDWKAIQKGDPDGKASMADFFGGRATVLPERDPVSLEPVAKP